MSVRTIGNRQNVSGSTMAVDLTTTIRIAVTGGLTTAVFVDSTTGFPATGTIFFPGGYSFVYTGVNTGVGSGERFSGASQSLPSVAVGALVTSLNSATLANPINPFRDTAIVSGTEEYLFTETGTGSGEGPINFTAGSSIVIGAPVIDSNIDLATGTTTTNQNAPYIYSEDTPTWSPISAYSVDDEVAFNGVKYKCSTAVAAGSNQRISLGFDNTVGTTGVNNGTQGVAISGFTAGQISLDESNGTGASTYTAFRIQNDSQANGGFFAPSTTQLNIFGLDRNRSPAPTISDWITAMITAINNPAGVTFRPEAADWLRFTAFQTTSGSETTITFEAKDGITWDFSSIDFGSADFAPYNSGSYTEIAAVNNSNPSIDTTNWTEDGVPLIKGWSINSSSIVPLDSETGFPGITTRVKFRFQNDYNSTGNTNWTMVNSDDTTAAPVFYGVDFNADGGSNASMNFVGAANNSFNSATGQGTPQFHDCTWTVNAGTSDVRWLGANMLINGFNYTSYGANARFEFGTAPLFAPRGVTLNAPNNNNLRIRAFLLFCQGGGVAANNAANTYVFENPTAANITLFNGNPGSTINNDANVGCVAINPVDAPFIPYATTDAGIATTTDFVNMMMPSKNNNASFWGSRLSTSTLMIGQRIKINFPSTGWTTRVIKTASSTYTRNDSNATTRDILWQSRSRGSVGGLVRDTTSTPNYNTTAEFFPTSGATPTTAVVGSTTPGSGGGIQNLQVLGTAFDENRLATNDVPVYYGLDDTISGNSIDLLIPAYTVFPNVTGIATANDTIYFNDYKIICQNDQYGTQVYNYSFDPAGSNYPTGYGNETWGDIVETVPETLIDNAYTDSITDLDTSPIESLQDIYNSLKIFERLRTSNTDYNASHRTSDTTFLTRTGKSFTTSFANIGITSIGRSVKTSGTSVNLKLASDWTNGNTDNVDQLVASGNIELSLFPDLTGVNLKAATFSNLPNAIPAVANLEGTYTKSDSTVETFTFTNSDVSNLALVNSNTGTKNIIRGTSADGTAIQPGDFASVTPSGAGVAGEWLFPLERKIEITLETTNTERTFRATYKGVDVTSEVTKDTTTVTGSTIYKYTGDGEGSFVIGVWVDGFNYAVVNTTALTAAFNLVSIPSEFLDFTTSLGELSTAVISSATPAFSSGVYTISLLKATIDTKLDNHSAVLGAEARLLTRRLLEKNNSSIAFLQSLSDDGKSRTFFTYDPAGWAIDIPAKSSADEIVQIVYSAEEAKDLVINVFPKDALGNAIWDRIVSDTPSLSPIFPPQGFTIITQSEESVQAFGKVVADEVSPAFKKTSRLIPVNDSDFPNI